jgi:CubicO group peptidase (beta-lactamase class C family)
VSAGGLSEAGLDRLHDVLASYVERGDVPGLAALVARGDDVHVEVLGTPALDDRPAGTKPPAPLRRDAIFRIASLTKPIAAAGAMALLDDGVLSVHDPVETYLPELADRQVLSPESVAAMTRNHLTAEQRAAAKLFLGEHGGWGYGMAAPGPITGEPPVPWGIGWTGGTGTLWWSDPVRGLTGILLTQRAMTSPQPPPLSTDFWDAAYAAIGD